MNEASYRELMEAGWHRCLSPEEEAQVQTYLALHPEQQTEWEEDAALNELLRQLPNAPVSSNFTALVLQAVEAEEREVSAPTPTPAITKWTVWVRSWIPKLAATGLVAMCSVIGIHQYQTHQANEERKLTQAMAQTLGEVAAVLPAQVLQDFDTIKEMRTASAASDEDLLAVLQR